MPITKYRQELKLPPTKASIGLEIGKNTQLKPFPFHL